MGVKKKIFQKDVAPVPAQYTGGSSQTIKNGCLPVGLPQPLQMEEKKFLLAVERGDIANVRRILHKAHRQHYININCMDPLGRRALTLAIDNENLEMVELLVIMGVETKDALLHAINAEFVEAVELLLEHEELIYKEGELYSWQKVEINTAMFPPDITPLILAAHKNNFEILKILLDRGAAVPVPHDIRCGCEECVRMSSEDSLRRSLSRVNTYKALSSPSLICLTSHDPILTAFQLSWELRNLAFTEQECKSEYMELRKQCQQFAVDLLDQSRTSSELSIILNYDPDMSTYQPGDRMFLNRLTQAIQYKQKRFVAHSNIQQLLSSIWYEGLPGFRRKSLFEKIMCVVKVALLFPIYCLVYMVAPNCKTGLLMRKPIMKFLIHASSYLFFLAILILVSQRADDDVIRLLGSERMKKELAEQQLRQRGEGPTKLELLVVLYVFGFMWEEVREIFSVGLKNYLRNMWNFIDFLRNSLYICVLCLRIFAYVQQSVEISHDPTKAFMPREKWHDFDPQLIAEGLFAAANIFSALKVVHMFSINPHLGPLQISLGRMVIDIVKFFFIYTLVLFAFACGLNQLLWYFAALERGKCYDPFTGSADWTGNADSCMKWRRFANLFESSQSLFWASFGMVGLSDFELEGIKSYTRFWGLLMFGSYSVINVIVLLNLLIAMMSNSYAMIDQHSDTEWKFARTKLWMSYFEDTSTLPPPFNILPSVKWLIRVFRKSSKAIDRKRSKKRQAKEQDNAYDNIMRSLVWRYIASQNRKFEHNAVTEDDINEVKSEISSMRYEMLEIFENSGMNISTAAKKEKPCRAKKTKMWERQLMKGFQVAPCQNVNDEKSSINVNSEGDINEIKIEKEPSRPVKETPKQRFQRVAWQVAQQSTAGKWTVVLQSTLKNSQIGRSSKDSARDLHNLGKAIEEAKKLILQVPSSLSGRESPIAVEFEDEKASTLLELLNQISEELRNTTSTAGQSKFPKEKYNQTFLQTFQRPPLAKDIKTIVKEYGVNSPVSLNQTKSLTTKAKTVPEIQTNKTVPSKTLSSMKSKELILTASELNKTNLTKKPAPPLPSTKTKTLSTKSLESTHVPFAVELGKAGRKPGYALNPYTQTQNQLPANYDLNVVNLEDDNDMMDDISQFSSDAYSSPKHESKSKK